MPLIIFGIGSNLGDKKKNIGLAISKLGSLYGSIVSLASIYVSSPLSIDDALNFDYLNTAVAFSTNSAPLEVFNQIKKIEKEIGRRSTKKWYPREIDIDILIYENNETNTDILQIPHKELLNRDFVLLPLIEIFKNLSKNTEELQNAFNRLEVKFVKEILLDNLYS